MKLALALLLAACSPVPAATAATLQAIAVDPAITELRQLVDLDGTTIRGNGAELDGRIYWLAGERGPNATPNCASTANWNTIEHTHHCPGSLLSIALDGSAFRVDHAFTQLDGVRQNVDGYHPYGSPVATGGCLVGVTQMGGVPVGAGLEAATARGVGVLWRYCPVAGSFEVLHNFFGVARAFDGMYPMGAPAALPDGRVCGTTKDGGQFSRGTTWCWSSTGFRYVSLTSESYGGVTLAGGLLHLTTNNGGENDTGAYLTVDPDTMAVTQVDSFPSFTRPLHADDNTSIQAPTLIDGRLFTARQFAGPFGTGMIARLGPEGISTMMWFDDIPLEGLPRFSNTTGAMANGRVTEAPNGMIMGVAAYGGAGGAGGIYEIARDGTRFRLLHSFDPNGFSYPYGGLMTASNGAIYGTTFNGGRGGSLFRYDPPVEACPL